MLCSAHIFGCVVGLRAVGFSDVLNDPQQTRRSLLSRNVGGGEGSERPLLKAQKTKARG